MIKLFTFTILSPLLDAAPGASGVGRPTRLLATPLQKLVCDYVSGQKVKTIVVTTHTAQDDPEKIPSNSLWDLDNVLGKSSHGMKMAPGHPWDAFEVFYVLQYPDPQDIPLGYPSQTLIKSQGYPCSM